MSKLIDRMFDSSFEGIHRNLDLRKKRSEAILSNVANAETPGYRASDVNFAGELDRAFSRNSTEIVKTSNKHMDLLTSEGQAHLIPDLSGATRPDGNNVDIDVQMARLAENSGKYNSSANLIRKKFEIIRQAIRFAQS
jgi:flagellar basal-body rod protein FlgB